MTSPFIIQSKNWRGGWPIHFIAKYSENVLSGPSGQEIRLERRDKEYPSQKATPVDYDMTVSYDFIRCSTRTATIVEPDGMPLQRIVSGDAYLRLVSPHCFEWQYVHSSREIIPYHLTQPIEAIVDPLVPNCYKWTVSKGQLVNDTINKPQYIPNGLPFPAKMENVMLTFSPFGENSLEQIRILEVYRDHLERDYQNFGVGTECGAPSLLSFKWRFSRYGDNWTMQQTWNCFGSVWHSYNGTGDGYELGIPTVGFTTTVYNDPIPWNDATSGLKRGDIVSFYHVDAATGKETLQHAHTCLSDSSQMYGANNEPVFGIYSRKDATGAVADPWEGGSWFWFVTSSHQYFDGINYGFHVRYPDSPQLLNRIKVHKK